MEALLNLMCLGFFGAGFPHGLECSRIPRFSPQSTNPEVSKLLRLSFDPRLYGCEDLRRVGDDVDDQSHHRVLLVRQLGPTPTLLRQE